MHMKHDTPVQVAPSILSADFAEIGHAVKQIRSAGADVVHLDVMDGSFVPNITFGNKMVADIRPLTDLPLDVHLMVEHPETMVDSYITAGADWITFHSEVCVHSHRLLQRITQAGKKAGISIVPSTPVAMVHELLFEIDLILVMTVNPGFGGQKIIPRCIDKISELSDIRSKHKLDFKISVDGGINEKNSKIITAGGADIMVSGSSFFKAANKKAYVKALKQ